MTHQQLTDFCNHLNLPVATDETALQQLKKMLLLEVKSSPEGILVIAGKSYDKNSINALFELNTDTLHWNVAGILDAFPILNQLSDFSLIPASPRRLPDNLWKHPDIQEFRKREAEPRFEAWKREVNQHFQKRDLVMTTSCIMLLPLFSEEQQFRVKSDLKHTLADKFTQVRAHLERGERPNALPEEAYFDDPLFYELVKCIANDDVQFLVLQLKAAEARIETLRSKSAALRIYKFQYKLPFPEDIRKAIKSHLNQLNEVHIQTNESSVSVWRVLWIVLIVILVIARGCRIASHF